MGVTVEVTVVMGEEAMMVEGVMVEGAMEEAFRAKRAGEQQSAQWQN